MRLRLVPETTRMNFFRMDRIPLLFSMIAVVASLVLFAIVGLNFGIDFRGGTLIMAETPEEQPVGDFRDVLTELDIGEVAVTRVSDPAGRERHAVLMRIGITDEDPDAQKALVTQVQETLNAAFPGISYLQIDNVGAKVSGELVTAGILAVVSAIAAILFYIWLRFEWQFSVAAVAALVHDVALTIGIFSLLQIEFNLSIIAAILTIVGYSLNDTVIVFDRVRENLRKYKTKDLQDVLNLSINETLARTVMTSGTTLIALLALYFLGGEVIRGFTFAMIWGVVVGTYSSIWIASTILLRLGVKRDWSKPSAGAGNQFANIDA
ncbi:protein translocase subunit SecF [Amaricoccus tamworthensis]|uniref:protein translocase subunit SecF n=1 Tax=Amaricoccus tamworthensis TaxID=57002 RepID=UPI003C7D9637